VRTTGPHVVEPSNRAGIYSEPRLGHVHLCRGLRFQTGPVACRRRFANRFESQHARNDAEAGGGRYRAGAAAGLKCQHAGRLGPRQTRDPLACTGGQQQVWRDVEHRQQSVVPGAPDGRLIAYSAEKGDVVLELPTGLQNGMGPPITFAIDGKQYIALMGGSGGMQSPGVTNPGATTSPSKPRLLVFGLDGQAPASAGPAPAPSLPDPHQADPHQ
jgi:hypothetical protein